MKSKAPVHERIVRHLKGMVTLCDEAAPVAPTGSAISDLLRDLAVKSESALLELRKEPLKA